MVLALIGGVAGLASIRGTPMVNQSLVIARAVAWKDLPASARPAAARTVALTLSVPGHVTTVAAMVLPHGLAVTTASIPAGAVLTGSAPGHVHFPVTWVGRDQVMGFSIVRLGVKMSALSLDPLPANAPVTALVPVVSSPDETVRFAWARTTLGDPTRRADGVVSYLATRSTPNLNGVPNAVALDAHGRVVAMLSSRGYWLDASFVAKVAGIVADGNGCHSGLGVTGQSAQGGGALVETVARRGPASARLLPGDVITSLAGHDVDTWTTLETILYLTPAGSTVELGFLRGTLALHSEVILACDL